MTKNNKYRNYAVTTMAAAAAVASVAPVVASADETEEFADADLINASHIDAVNALVESGVINGYDVDNTFRPFDDVQRLQVAKMLKRELDLEVPENADEILAGFSDVPVDVLAQEDLDAIAAVAGAGFITGDHGEFKATDATNREQMATMLVRAFDLDEIETDANVEVDFSEVSSTHQDAVQTLANLEITTESPDFRAWEDVDRQQFASFMYRTMNVIEAEAELAVEGVSAIDNGDGTVTVTGEVVNGTHAHVIVKDPNGEDVANDEAIELAEDGTFTFTTDVLAAGEYSYVAMGMKDGEHGAENKVTGTVEVEAVELAVEGVSANSPTQADVTLNADLDGIDKDDLTVTNQDGEKQYVKSVGIVDEDGEVKAAAAGQSTKLRVEFYNPLKSGDTYTFSVKVGEETVSADLEFEIGDVAKIEADTSQTVEHTDGDVNLESLDFKVLDDAGLDITSQTDVEFESTADFVKDSESTINLNAGDSAFVYVVAVNEDGDKVKSDRITVKAEKSTTTEITDWTIDSATADKSENVFEDEDYEQNLNVQKSMDGQYLHIAGENQFGDATYPDTVKYESLDKSVALVDRNTGEIKPLKEGSFPVKVKAGDVTKTIELSVVADAKADSIELDKSEVSISNKIQKDTSVEYTVLNQYNTGFNADSVTAEVKSGEDVITVTNDYAKNAEGKGTIKVQPAKDVKSGTAIIEIKVNDEVKTTLTVNVTEAGEVDGYIVEGFETELDKNEDEESNTMDLSVFPVDENGVKTDDAVNAEYTVKDENGDEVEGAISQDGKIDVTKTDKDGSIFKTDETYTVTAKVGTIEVFEDKFSVVDTSPQPEVELTSSTLETNGNIPEDIFNDLAELFEVSYKGDKVSSTAITNITFSSDNEDVVDSGEDLTSVNTKSEGDATLAVSSITVDVDENGEVDNRVIKLDNEPINVSVADKTDPVINDAQLIKAGEKLTTKFSLSEDIDFSKGADVEISYFTKADGDLTPILNYAENAEDDDGNATPLVKDKFWSGYLAEGAGTGDSNGTNYSNGHPDDPDHGKFEDVLPAGTTVGTNLNQYGDKEDGIVDLDTDTIVVKIVVTDNVGNVSEVKELTYTPDDSKQK